MKNGLRVILVALLLALAAPSFAYAAPPSTLTPSCAQKKGGCDTLDSIIQLGVNYGRFVMGISGAIALVFFVYGGIVMLTSTGNADSVKKGKDILTAAVVGLVIIFGAFTAVRFGLKILDPTEQYDFYVTNPPK